MALLLARVLAAGFVDVDAVDAPRELAARLAAEAVAPAGAGEAVAAASGGLGADIEGEAQARLQIAYWRDRRPLASPRRHAGASRLVDLDWRYPIAGLRAQGRVGHKIKEVRARDRAFFTAVASPSSKEHEPLGELLAEAAQGRSEPR